MLLVSFQTLFKEVENTLEITYERVSNEVSLLSSVFSNLYESNNGSFAWI